MRIIDLVLKDLSQIFRDKRSFVFLLAMPAVFTFFMGFAYRSDEGGEPGDARLSLAWVEAEPVGDFNQVLFARLEESHHVQPLRMAQDAALESLERAELDGVLLIPLGFGEHTDASLRGGWSTESPAWQITLIADPSSNKGQSLYQLLRLLVSQLMSAVEISHISVDVLGDPDEFEPALELAWEKWAENSTSNLVHIEQAVTQVSESWFGDNPYNQASPGILVQFAIMGLVTSAQILVRERQSRTFQRLMTTALKPWEILFGHMLAMFAVVFTQTILLIIFGQLILGVAYARAPLSVLLVAVTLGVWVSSMGLLIGLLAKGDDQVVLYAMIAMFFFSALGGAWFPLETTGSTFITLGRLLPSAWAMTGFQNVLIRGLGFASIWQPACALLAYALGFFALAVWRCRNIEI